MSVAQVQVIEGRVLALHLSAAGPVDWSDADRETWEDWCDEFRPRLIVVTDLDESQDDFEDVAAEVQDLVGEDSTVVLRYLPLHDDAGQVAGLLDLLTEEIRDYSTGSLKVSACDLEHRLLTGDARADLITIIATRADDDSILERVIALMPVDLREEFARQFARGDITPIMPVDSVGSLELAELITAATA